MKREREEETKMDGLGLGKRTGKESDSIQSYTRTENTRQ